MEIPKCLLHKTNYVQKCYNHQLYLSPREKQALWSWVVIFNDELPLASSYTLLKTISFFNLKADFLKLKHLLYQLQDSI